MTLSLALAVISKIQKPITDQNIRDTQTNASQEESTLSPSEYKGIVININYILCTLVEPSISELKINLKT